MENLLAELSRRRASQTAIVEPASGRRASWRELDAAAASWESRLAGAGARPGDRIAAPALPSIDFAALLNACLRSGLCLVPISPRAPNSELQRILADCRPRLFPVEGELKALDDPVRGTELDATILYTSGTTGAAKGVRLTRANHLASSHGCLEALGAVESDRWLLTLSPHHVGGLAILIRSLVGGHGVVALPRFEEAAILGAIASERPTFLSVVPTMLSRLVATGGRERLRGLRAILVGGAPAPADIVRGWAESGLPVCPTYGLTETASQIAIVPPGRAAELAGSSGLLGSQARVEIVDGEIVVSGPCVTAGYLSAEIGGQPTNGCFATGDLGRLDGSLLTVLGRKDDTVITGGENVQPEEVEAVLCAHPGVLDAAVTGRPDADLGAVLVAWVVGDVSVPEIEAWCRDRLAPFKVPRAWYRVDGLPRNEAGKLLRNHLPATRQSARR